MSKKDIYPNNFFTFIKPYNSIKSLLLVYFCNHLDIERPTFLVKNKKEEYFSLCFLTLEKERKQKKKMGIILWKLSIISSTYIYINKFYPVMKNKIKFIRIEIKLKYNCHKRQKKFKQRKKKRVFGSFHSSKLASCPHMNFA